ncbi:MAG: polyribonucleotide nucleotidyltransferase [Chloroflexi bacterium]|nr:polyribonucleotide nucleotidyltransferase [Chloroflexota bacterium]
MLSTFSREVGTRSLSLESGKLALQANGSVVLRYGDCVLLITATMSKPREGIDFFPLTIEFEERLYARGKIPGSFFRREGRPSTEAILVDRLTDRPVRPLFPKGFKNEVQVIITPLSVDLENTLDVLAVIGASAALSVSDIPFEGPIGATRMGYVDGEFVVNPTFAQMDESDLDLVVAGTRDGVLMMEAGANELSEDLVLEGIRRAQDVNQRVIELQDDLIRSAGRPKIGFTPVAHSEELERRTASVLGARIASTFDASLSKTEQADRMSSLKAELAEAVKDEFEPAQIADAFDSLLEKEFRTKVLSGGPRPDGRGLRDIRPISCEVSLLPRTHGTGLFNRGETQVLGVVTLGSVGDAQRLDNLSPQDSKRFLLHYNFPPYSVGEVRRVGSPGRREIGHGALAERALTAVLPSEEDFPYTIRLVSEVLGSNGSTSMATVCAGTLALMDAGVPIKKPIAGISVGLVVGENGQYATLTDIQGLEDHIGDMDFKVAGSRDGITAIQLDMKVKNIGFDVIRDALEQAKEARLFLLDRIEETISEARADLSPYAPRMTRIKIPVDKIGIVIGPGGKTIRAIVEETKATVDVADDGTVTIGSSDSVAAARAVTMIEDLTKDIKVGEIYTGKVVKIAPFGAFVQLRPGKDGMVHISELADYRVPTVEDVVQLGEDITVIVIDVDPTGRVKLSRRALLQGDGDSAPGDGASGPPTESSSQQGGYRGGGRPTDGRPPQSRDRPGGDRGGYRSRGPRRGGSGGPRPEQQGPRP